MRDRPTHSMPPAHYIEEHTRKIFDVPIYRCTEERYYKEREREEKELIIPNPTDQNRCAQSRNPIDMIVQGWSTSLFQAKQQCSRMSS